jgi:hypothetical protein
MPQGYFPTTCLYKRSNPAPEGEIQIFQEIRVSLTDSPNTNPEQEKEQEKKIKNKAESRNKGKPRPDHNPLQLDNLPITIRSASQTSENNSPSSLTSMLYSPANKSPTYHMTQLNPISSSINHDSNPLQLCGIYTQLETMSSDKRTTLLQNLTDLPQTGIGHRATHINYNFSPTGFQCPIKPPPSSANPQIIQHFKLKNFKIGYGNLLLASMENSKRPRPRNIWRTLGENLQELPPEISSQIYEVDPAKFGRLQFLAIDDTSPYPYAAPARCTGQIITLDLKERIEAPLYIFRSISHPEARRYTERVRNNQYRAIYPTTRAELALGFGTHCYARYKVLYQMAGESLFIVIRADNVLQHPTHQSPMHLLTIAADPFTGKPAYLFKDPAFTQTLAQIEQTQEKLDTLKAWDAMDANKTFQLCDAPRSEGPLTTPLDTFWHFAVGGETISGLGDEEQINWITTKMRATFAQRKKYSLPHYPKSLNNEPPKQDPHGSANNQHSNYLPTQL